MLSAHICSFVLFLLWIPYVQPDDHLRPAAIIPWSQYQQRMSSAKSHLEIETAEEVPQPTRQKLRKPSYNEKFGSAATSIDDATNSERKKSYENVIRPQIKGRLPMTNERPTVKIQQNSKTHLPTTSNDNSYSTRRKAHLPIRDDLVPKKALEQSVMQNLEIPNGVPMYSGTWDAEEPNYVSERRYSQQASNTLHTAPLSIPQNLHDLTSGLKPAPPNIVSSIFNQARGEPIQSIVAPPSQGQAILDKLLSDGSSMDQISRLAKNLLGVGESNGEGGLLEAMTRVLGAPRLPPTSSAADGAADVQAAPRSQNSIFEKLISKAAMALNDSIKQQSLKDSAVKNINNNIIETPETTSPATDVKPKVSKDRENSIDLLKDLPEDQRKLLEAAIVSGEIDANAPALQTLIKDDVTEDSKMEKQTRLIEWIRSNRKPAHSKEVVVASDKLPYYGKYCGSFTQQAGVQKKLQATGAIWAVDEKRIIVSKFVYQPGSLLTENVTFWLGPEHETGNILQDIMPSENGFYLQPKPINVEIFAVEELPPITASIRKQVIYVAANSTQLRKKPTTLTEKEPIELVVKGGVVVLNPNADAVNTTYVKAPEVVNDTIPRGVVPSGLRLKQPENDIIDESLPRPLEWYAGFQPLLLTLPENRTIKDVHWIALRDHNRQETVASTLLPNGPAFQVPAVSHLRPLSPNAFFNVSSGPIDILDMKTIQINNFSLTTSDDDIWFMVGKDILPNVNGHIVPIFDTNKRSFDCEALRNYYNENVVLRLPGQLDMKDVFWISIFAHKRALSYSHIYVPYNDMTLIPDFSAIAVSDNL